MKAIIEYFKQLFAKLFAKKPQPVETVTVVVPTEPKPEPVATTPAPVVASSSPTATTPASTPFGSYGIGQTAAVGPHGYPLDVRGEEIVPSAPAAENKDPMVRAVALNITAGGGAYFHFELKPGMVKQVVFGGGPENGDVDNYVLDANGNLAVATNNFPRVDLSGLSVGSYVLWILAKKDTKGTVQIQDK